MIGRAPVNVDRIVVRNHLLGLCRYLARTMPCHLLPQRPRRRNQCNGTIKRDTRHSLLLLLLLLLSCFTGDSKTVASARSIPSRSHCKLCPLGYSQASPLTRLCCHTRTIIIIIASARINKSRSIVQQKTEGTSADSRSASRHHRGRCLGFLATSKPWIAESKAREVL